MNTEERVPGAVRYPTPAALSDQARMILSMPPQRAVYPHIDDTAAWLELIQAGDAALPAAMPPAPESIEAEVRDIDGVRVYVHRPSESAAGGPVYLDFHPGGLIGMGGEACRLVGAHVAQWLGLEVWSVDYRMPPLHPFPAGLDDALTAYRALLSSTDPASVIVGGVSAGGNIAAALMVRAAEEQLPAPAALYLGTPECDLTESGDSFAVNQDADNTLASLREVNRLYAGSHDLAHPHLSPLFGELSGFPPTILTTGTRDLFLSNTVRMHRSLRAAGVPADLHVFEAMPHIGFPGSPEDLELRAEVKAFLMRHLSL